MHAQSLPRRPHPEDVAALAAFTARQTAGDLAPVLKHIQMPPRQFFRVVIAGDRTCVFRTAHRFPQALRLLDGQKYTVPLDRSNRLSLTSQFSPNPNKS